MKTIIYLSLTLTAALTWSCQHPAQHEHNPATALELNQGQKWQVNPEMKPAIAAAEELLMRANDTNTTALAAGLESYNKQLIASCTMQGKSHDELHKWLHPHMELVQTLLQAKDAEEAQVAIRQLKTSFQTYHMFFE
jgi:hypothetical protein